MPNATDGILLDAFNLKPVEAIRYLKSKGYATSWNWYEVWQEAHAKAFTVAKAMRMDILQSIRDEVERAITDGRTLQQFKKELTPRLKALGWWGITTDEQGKEIQLGSPYRLRTIYRTNIQTAYMAGRYKAAKAVSQGRPWWQYIATLDSKTRPAHRALHGKVFRHDDPFWNTHYPPNGWGCRCRVRTLADRDIKRRGLTPEDTASKIVTREVPVGGGDNTHLVKVHGYKTTTGDGQPITVWTGKGWDYNPGAAAWQPDLDRYEYDVAQRYVEGSASGPAFKRFIEAKGSVRGDMPVAILNPAYRTAIGAQSQTVLLSDETLAKNVRNHPELSLPEYQALPRIVQDADTVVRDGDRTLVFISVGSRIYHAAIKTTQSGQTLFLTSFRRSSLEEAKRATSKGGVLWNNL
jgi:SPP1 gp7 family putative phage head morphogenesis protein